jgi:hypothetical protein
MDELEINPSTRFKVIFKYESNILVCNWILAGNPFDALNTVKTNWSWFKIPPARLGNLSFN